MVASGGKGAEQIAQECLAKDSLGWRTDPYTLEREVSFGVRDGRMPDSGAGRMLEYFNGDGGRLDCEVVDAMCAATRLPSPDCDDA